MVSQPNQENQPEEIINENDFIGTTHKVNLPVVDNTNGPFRLAVIVTRHSARLFNNCLF